VYSASLTFPSSVSLLVEHSFFPLAPPKHF
jgi:hypothetical protein